LLQQTTACIPSIPKYHMKMLLGDFNAKVGKEDVLKVTIGNGNQ
jgi:hypothetical protein